MRIAIVEDEPVLAARVERMCRNYFSDGMLRIDHFDDLHEAEDFLAEYAVDLVMLDLNLNGEDGFELLKLCSAGAFFTIIVSAHGDQALRAFEYGVLDFVAKPFTQARLEKALSRVTDARWRSETPLNFLAVKSPQGLQLVALSELRYVRASGHYGELVLTDGRVKLHDKCIEKLERLLPANFLRIHRSYLVPTQHIAALVCEPGGRYYVRLHDGERLPLARSRYAAIRERFPG